MVVLPARSGGFPGPCRQNLEHKSAITKRAIKDNEPLNTNRITLTTNRATAAKGSPCRNQEYCWVWFWAQIPSELFSCAKLVAEAVAKPQLLPETPNRIRKITRVP